MNEFLAQMYGTAEALGLPDQSQEIEKEAQAEVLGQIILNEGIDPNSLSGDDLQKVAHEVFGEQNLLSKEASEPELTEDQQKLAEADYLGRVMAHAYVNELNTMDKQASTGAQSILQKLAQGPCEKCGKEKCECPAAKEEAPPAEKEASALDKLAAERARAILRENGIDVDEQQKLAQAVEERAWQMLKEAGYAE